MYAVKEKTRDSEQHDYMEHFLDNIIEQLVTRRKQLGITQKKLSIMSGVGQSTISKIESRDFMSVHACNNRTLSVTTIARLAIALGFSLKLADEEETK